MSSGREDISFRGMCRLVGVVSLVGCLASCTAVPEPRKAPSSQEAHLKQGLTAPDAQKPAEPPVLASAEPVPVSRSGRPAFSGILRIGLATDLVEVVLPCCDGEVAAELGGTRLELISPIVVRAMGTSTGAREFRLQLAALRDEVEAKRLAQRARSRGGLEPVEVAFEATSGLYRVRGGRFSDRDRARREAERLRARGFEVAWIVEVPLSGVMPSGLEVHHRGRIHRISGSRVTVAAVGPEGTVRFQNRRYRGTLEVVLNPRGLLNVVNVLPLETYLRGVVPKELGPEIYPELEALKAQAVAARTYALSHLGEFSEEGFDLCATPRCQVYGGADAEHPRSDRAIGETEGEILVVGAMPIEAFYSATCGGHTENVEVVFPTKESPALVGVPCIESGAHRLHLPTETGRPLPEAVLAQLLGETQVFGSVEGFERTVAGLVRLAGLAAVQQARLGSLEAPEILRFLAQRLELGSAAALFVQPEELEYLLGSSTVQWPEDLRLVAGYLAKSGVMPPAPGGREFGREWLAELLFRLGLWLGAIEFQSTRFEAVRNGNLIVRSGDSTASWPVLPGLKAYRRQGERLNAVRDLVLLAGDQLELYGHGERLLALVHEVHPQGATFDREHPRSSWVRLRSDEELRRLVRERFPGFELVNFEILGRGKSGRVGALRLVSRDGAEEVVEGLAIRWILDLPDTWFLQERITLPGRGEGWRFRGRGWGHGVGLCQVGAVGMARRGHDYRSILAHYYRGAAVVRLETSEQAAAGLSGAVGELVLSGDQGRDR